MSRRYMSRTNKSLPQEPFNGHSINSFLTTIDVFLSDIKLALHDRHEASHSECHQAKRECIDRMEKVKTNANDITLW
jgi:C4-type Zn-finger protein